MGRGADPKVSIVIPARNEARNLEMILPELPGAAEIILVDGHSVDDTVEITKRLLPSAVVVTQTRTGKGNALACGFEAATGDVVVMFDADGSADPAEIPAFVETLVRGADFAKGTRYREPGGSDDITILRRLGNSALNRLANLLYDTAFSDLCYGYNAFWRDIVPQLGLPAANAHAGRRLWGDGFEIETVLSCRVVGAGLKVAEVPSFERRRVFGETNLRTFSDGARVLRTIFSEYHRYRTRRRSGLPGTGDLAAQELA
ncbi:glycosyltransferase family 2 protein [Amycolatopsis benzoatilytica]|uniref:glycosyltransferase family 2 protein n=1 Tax=Amycolatopsis benzoatilytica TaxID=346045 RepID=UPI0003730AAE|nr:glycosyltransferase family 2 protein [Amycolatopsis benzoatilytica]